MAPLTILPGGSIKPSSDRPVTVLPEPDSPTMPSTSPRPTSNETPSTAFTTPARVKKWTLRSSTTSTADMILSFQPRVHDVAQLVADQIDGDDRDQQRDAGIEGDPVFARQHEAVAVRDQQPQRRLGDRHADAEERERGLERDRVRDL